MLANLIALVMWSMPESAGEEVKHRIGVWSLPEQEHHHMQRPKHTVNGA
jgi:hypothetical protein